MLKRDMKEKDENKFLMLLYMSVIFPRLTQTSIFSTKRIHVLSLWTCTQPGDIFSLFSDSFNNLSLSVYLSDPLFQSMALAWPQSHLPCANTTSITSINHQHASSWACWIGLCGKPCCLGPGGVLWGTSNLLQHLWWPPRGWRCVGSPAARWSSRLSMTTTTVVQMDGRSALGKANGLFSWKRPTLTGGRWGNSSSFVCLVLMEPNHPQRSVGFLKDNTVIFYIFVIISKSHEKTKTNNAIVRLSILMLKSICSYWRSMWLIDVF